jgi:anthranilate phosphoribosyltransferase
VGVYSPDIIPLMANSLKLLGMKRALVVHSLGLDELTPMGPATVAEIMDGKVKKLTQHSTPLTHKSPQSPSALWTAKGWPRSKKAPLQAAERLFGTPCTVRMSHSG